MTARTASMRNALLSIALAIAAIVPSLTPRAQETPTPQPLPPELAPPQLNALYEYGRTLRLCELYDEAHAMYLEAARRNLELPKGSPEQIRTTCEYVLYCFRTGAPDKAQPFIEKLRDILNWVQDPTVRCLDHMVEACSARQKRDWNAFAYHIDRAQNEATRTPYSLRLQGDANLLKAEATLEQEHPADAIKTAENALSLYSLAREPLAAAEAQRTIARCHDALGQTAAAAIARQQAQSIVTPIDIAPIFNLAAIRNQAAQLAAYTETLPREGRFQETINALFSLLRLKRARAEGRSEALGEIATPLNEAEILINAAINMRQRQHLLAAKAMFERSNAIAAAEIEPVAKARYRYLTARYLRESANPRAAVEELAAAERVLDRVQYTDIRMRIGIQEERGLALLAMGQPSGAIHAFTAAIQLATQAALQEETQRLTFYKEQVEKGVTDPAMLTNPPRESEENKRLAAQKQLLRTGPPALRSPFVADYEPGQITSAAQRALEAPLVRPRPSPTRIHMSPDILINTKQYKRAIAEIESEIMREGETLKRLLQLGQSYYNTRQWAEAKDAFQRALKIDPDNTRAKEYLRGIEPRMKTQEKP